MVGNPPFPADGLLRAWSQSGVELIVIMEGASWVGSTDRYWRVGTYPCYRETRDMRDLDRLIRSAHRFGMRTVDAARMAVTRAVRRLSDHMNAGTRQ